MPLEAVRDAHPVVMVLQKTQREADASDRHSSGTAANASLRFEPTDDGADYAPHLATCQATPV
jgi:hypothetical protein